MQRSLKRYVGRPSAPAAGQEPSCEQQGPSKPAASKQSASRSGLVAALSSQIVRGGTSGGEAAAASQGQAAQPLRERPFNQPAAQTPAAQQTCEQALARGMSEPTSRQQPPPLPPEQQQQQAPRQAPPPGMQQQQQQQRQQPVPLPPQQQQPAPQPAPPPGMQACPLCGQLLPAGEALQRHINEELDALDAEEDWTCSSNQPPAGPPASIHQWQAQAQAQQPQQQQQQGAQQRLPRRQQQQQQAAVLVLGGAPSITAPTDRRRLAQLQRQRLLPPKRPRQLPSDEYNHYDDGRGGWGGEDIGLEGEAGGLKWEGMGTSDF